MTHAIIGGAAIGLATVLMLLFLGRIAGISGIARTAILEIKSVGGPQLTWRWMFLLGLPLGTWLAHALTGQAVPDASSANLMVPAFAGILVGYGVTLGSGCTSGHGICGIARLSKRSLVATLCFMAAGVASTFVMRHVFSFI